MDGTTVWLFFIFSPLIFSPTPRQPLGDRLAPASCVVRFVHLPNTNRHKFWPIRRLSLINQPSKPLIIRPTSGTEDQGLSSPVLANCFPLRYASAKLTLVLPVDRSKLYRLLL